MKTEFVGMKNVYYVCSSFCTVNIYKKSGMLDNETTFQKRQNDITEINN